MLALAILVGVLVVLLFLQKVDVLWLDVNRHVITGVVSSIDVEFEYLSDLLLWLLLDGIWSGTAPGMLSGGLTRCLFLWNWLRGWCRWF